MLENNRPVPPRLPGKVGAALLAQWVLMQGRALGERQVAACSKVQKTSGWERRVQAREELEEVVNHKLTLS